MKAKIGEDVVDVWEVSHDEPKEDWVKDLFEKKNLSWSKTADVLQYLPGAQIHPALGLVGGYMGAQMTMGKCGDYLVFMNGSYRMLSPKKFDKDFIVMVNS